MPKSLFHYNYLLGALKCTPIRDVKELILELNNIQDWLLLGRELKIEQDDLEQWKVSILYVLIPRPTLLCSQIGLHVWTANCYVIFSIQKISVTCIVCTYMCVSMYRVLACVCVHECVHVCVHVCEL